MSTNSSHEDSGEIKKIQSDKDELQEMRTKNIVSEIVEARINKLLNSVKWVVGTLSVILAFFGWSTFTGMQEAIRNKVSNEVKQSVSDQIRQEISNQSILEGLPRDFNELQDNLVLENLKLKVNLYNDGRQGLIGDRDNDIIPKRYEAVLKNMIYGRENKASEVINILNDISPEKIYFQKDFFGDGFDTVKKYAETVIRNTKDQNLKLACTKFLINFCFDENEKFNLVMDYLQKTKDDREITYLLPRIAFHLRFNNRNTDQPIPKDFIDYCKDKIKKCKDSVLLISSYLSLLSTLKDNEGEFNKVKKEFEQQCKSSMSRFPDILDVMDFLMEFNFLFLSNDNDREYKTLVTRFLANIYKINNGTTSSNLKAKLFLLSNINQEFYLEIFKNLINDKRLSQDDKLRLFHQFSVQGQQEDSKNLEYVPITYLQNENSDMIKVRVDLDSLRIYDDYGNIYKIHSSDSLFIQVEKRIPIIYNNN
jgi:hypothetical protein